VGADYARALPIGTFDFSAHLYYTSQYSFEPSPRISQGSYKTLALRASYQPLDSRFSVYAYGDNVTSTKYFENVLNTSAGDEVRYARPATYGVGAKYKF
jgi:hypothetical protein